MANLERLKTGGKSKMKIIDGSVTAAKGFRATGAAVGIKKGVKDLALIASDVPATAAAALQQMLLRQQA